MYRTPSTLFASLVLLANSVAVSAVCTGWKQDSIHIDDGQSFSVAQTLALETKSCDADAKSSCYIDRKDYNVTAPRVLTLEKGIREHLEGYLSSDELDAIFSLAQKGFLSKAYPKNNSDTVNGDGKLDFKTRTTVVSTLDDESVPDHSSLLEVKPGTNRTLGWTAFYQYSYGTLSGCANETLNNLSVIAGSSYITIDPRRANTTVLAGTFSAASQDIKDSAAGAMFDARGASALFPVYGLLAAGVILGWSL